MDRRHAMALCLADSLIASRGFDPLEQLQRYVRWFREGYMSSTGQCFDIGNIVRASLVHFEKTGAPYCEMEELYTPPTSQSVTTHDRQKSHPMPNRAI